MGKLKMLVASIFAVSIIFMYALPVIAQDDIKEHRNCVHCGMDRKAYGYSRMMVHYEDGTSVGVCSLHCAVVEMDKDPLKKVKKIEVADRDIRTLTDAVKAYWVMGGKKRGVMTQSPKWAFESKSSAEAFITANGGKLATWTEALTAAREDIIPKK